MLHRDSRAMVALLAALTALGPLSTDMYLASLPSMTAAFRTGVAEVQLTLSVFLVGFAAAQLVYGPLADRFGRRPVLLGGLLTYTLASLACALAPSIEVLTLARLLQAVGACAGPVLARAVVRDLHGRERAARMLSYMGMVMGFAPAVAPVIGGYLHVAFGWSANFLFLAAFGAAALALVWRYLGESLERPDRHALAPRRMAATFSSLLASRRYLGYALCCCFCYAGLFAFISGSSFVLIGAAGVEEQHFGYFFGLAVIGYIAGASIGGRLSLKLGIDRLLLAGSGLAALSGLVMVLLAGAGAGGPAPVVGPMIFYMAAVGLVLPQAMAGALSPYPQAAGSASALLGFLQMSTAAVVGGGVGHLHDGTALPMAAAIAAMGSATLLSFLLLVRRGGDLPARR